MREMGLLFSAISILIGLMLLLFPKKLVQLGEQTNRLYNMDGLVYRNRFLFGSILSLAGIFLMYSALGA